MLERTDAITNEVLEPISIYIYIYIEKTDGREKSNKIIESYFIKTKSAEVKTGCGSNPTCKATS
jgi:hypothetical protein